MPQLSLVFVYLWTLAVWGLVQYIRLSADADFIGEEIWFGYRNVLCFDHGLQPGSHITSYSGILLYWIASHLFPVTFFSTRIFKVLTVSFLPVVLLLVVRHIVPNLSRTALAVFLAVVTLAPPLVWYSILPLENGWECVFGFLLLYLALQFRGTWDWNLSWGLRAFGFLLLTAFLAHLYPAALTLIATAYAVLFVRVIAQPEQRMKRVASLGGYSLLTALACLWPYLVITTRPLTMFTGGGFSILREHRVTSLFGELALHISSWRGLGAERYFNDFFWTPSSYLLDHWVPYAAFPLYRNGVVFVALLVVGVWSVGRARGGLWLLLPGLLNVPIIFFSAAYSPGFRRALPLFCSVACMIAIGCDRLVKLDKPAWVSKSVCAGLLAALLWSLAHPLLFEAQLFNLDLAQKPVKLEAEDFRAAPQTRPPLEAYLQATERARTKHVALIVVEQAGADDFRDVADKAAKLTHIYSVIQDPRKALVPLLCSQRPLFRSWVVEATPGALPYRCLPELLQSAGVATAFYSVSPSWSEPRRSLVENLGFETIVAAESAAALDRSSKFLATHSSQPTFVVYYLPSVDRLTQFSAELRQQYAAQDLREQTTFIATAGYNSDFKGHLVQGSVEQVVFETDTRVPFAIDAPGALDIAASPTTPLSQLDIVPTIAELFGYRVERSLREGRSLLAQEEWREHRTLFTACGDRQSCVATPATESDQVREQARAWLRDSVQPFSKQIEQRVAHRISKEEPTADTQPAARFAFGVELLRTSVYPPVVLRDGSGFLSLDFRLTEPVPKGWRLTYDVLDSSGKLRYQARDEVLMDAFEPDQWPIGKTIRGFGYLPGRIDGLFERYDVFVSFEHPQHRRMEIFSGENVNYDRRGVHAGRLWIVSAAGIWLLTLAVVVVSTGLIVWLTGPAKFRTAFLIPLLLAGHVGLYGETFFQWSRYLSQNYQAWHLMRFKTDPGKSQVETIQSHLNQLQQGNLRLERSDYNANYFSVLEMFCRRGDLNCNKIESAPVDEEMEPQLPACLTIVDEDSTNQ